MRKTSNEHPLEPQEVANDDVHTVTNKTITKHNQLTADPLLLDVWSRGMSKEMGQLTQDFGTTKGTNTMQFMDPESIKHIPRDRVVAYARILLIIDPRRKIPTK